MLGEAVTFLSAGTTVDDYGNTVEDWSAPTETTVTTLAPLEPRPQGETFQNDRNAVVSGWTLYLPSNAVVTPQNRVRVRGKVYPVQGEPADWGEGIVVQAFGTVG